MKGCAGNIALLATHYMSDLSPSPSFHDGAHAVLVAADGKMLVGDVSICCGILYALSIRHRPSRWMVAKAFSIHVVD